MGDEEYLLTPEPLCGYICYVKYYVHMLLYFPDDIDKLIYLLSVNFSGISPDIQDGDDVG